MVSFILFGCSKEFLYCNNKLQCLLPNIFHDIGARQGNSAMAIPKTTSEIMYELIFMTKRCVIWHLMVFRPSLFFYGFGNSGSTLHNNTLSNACIVEGVACECEKHKTEWIMSPSSKQLQNSSNCCLILPICTLVSFWWNHVCALCVISGLS